MLLLSLQYARRFYLICPLLLLLQIALLSVEASNATFGGLEAGVLACCLVMLAATFVGGIGVWRLRADLEADADGRGSSAQRALEAFFWFVLLLSLVTCVLSAVDLVTILNGDADAAITDEASKFPEVFIAKARRVGVNPAPNTGSVSGVQHTLAGLKIAAATLAGLHLLLALPALWCVAKVVTFLELLRDLVRSLSVLNVVLALGLLFFAVQGIALALTLLTLTPDEESASSNENTTLLPPILAAAAAASLGVFAVCPVTIYGLQAAHHENIGKLEWYQLLAALVALCSMTVGVGTLLVIPAYVSRRVDSSCRDILQSVPEAWLASLPPSAGCSKYYGRAMRVDSLGHLFVDPRSPHVGHLTNCLHSSDRVLAWEYADGPSNQSCSTSGLYSCLNLGLNNEEAGCCASLRASISFYFVMLGAACLAVTISLVCAAIGARVIAKRFLSNPAIRALVEKRMRRKALN